MTNGCAGMWASPNTSRAWHTARAAIFSLSSRKSSAVACRPRSRCCPSWKAHSCPRRCRPPAPPACGSSFRRPARNYALERNMWKDERRDVVESTRAALDYLQKLYDMFGDWHLAFASYNWGEGAVSRAIAKNQRAGKPARYTDLQMPIETRNYVPSCKRSRTSLPIRASTASFCRRSTTRLISSLCTRRAISTFDCGRAGRDEGGGFPRS